MKITNLIHLSVSKACLYYILILNIFWENVYAFCLRIHNKCVFSKKDKINFIVNIF